MVTASPSPYLRQLLIYTLFALGLLLILRPSSSALAANFTVNLNSDTLDSTPGDGLCADSLGHCTLRAAIQEANALPGADTITIPSDTYTLSLVGTAEDGGLTGDLDILDDLTLSGSGANLTLIQAGTTAGTGIDRIFQVHPGITAVLDNVTHRYGTTGNCWPHCAGAALFNEGNTTLHQVLITDNITDQSGGGHLQLPLRHPDNSK